MQIGVLKESFAAEKRVALTPAVVARLMKKGFAISVESGAGERAGFLDQDYVEKGATVTDRAAILKSCETLLAVRAGGADLPNLDRELKTFRAGQTLIALLDPLSAADAAQKLADAQVTSFSMELIPRITRAQSMDALSSMATIAGYKAVLIAANTLPKMFPMMMTAAGTLTPAKVLILGAGVAGLQAIATARRLGGVVYAYDIRPAVKEQVESLGAKFVELDLSAGEAEDKGGYAKAMGDEFIRRQQELMAKVVADSDVVITTAAIPGRKSPVLVTTEMVKGMRSGSVIVDLAAERGGNCELTVAGETVVKHNVTIIGPLNIPAEIPYHASEMYAKNISTLLLHLAKDGEFAFDMDDEITVGTLISKDGEVVHGRIRGLLGLDELEKPTPKTDEADASKEA